MIFFRAPQGFYEKCPACTDAIKPGSIVVESTSTEDDEVFLHLDCLESLRDDAREAS
jgi:hypothetical protein